MQNKLSDWFLCKSFPPYIRNRNLIVLCNGLGQLMKWKHYHWANQCKYALGLYWWQDIRQPYLNHFKNLYPVCISLFASLKKMLTNKELELEWRLLLLVCALIHYSSFAMPQEEVQPIRSWLDHFFLHWVLPCLVFVAFFFFTKMPQINPLRRCNFGRLSLRSNLQTAL